MPCDTGTRPVLLCLLCSTPALPLALALQQLLVEHVLTVLMSG